MAAVRSHQQVSRRRWAAGGFSRLYPLPALGVHGYCVGHLDELGRAAIGDVLGTERVACLSEIGVNLLQQRLTFHLTRAEIPTERFHEAFAHTIVEADILEDWTDTLTEGGRSVSEAAKQFETFIRTGEPTLQEQLRQPERRAFVRSTCSRQARAIAGQH